MNIQLIIILSGLIRFSDEIIYNCNQNASCGCSINPANLTRIVGGEPASTRSWSWTVWIDANNALCAGSIISLSWIITAAHCLFNLKLETITVFAGSDTLNSIEQSRRARRVLIHPNYVQNTGEYDIALIQLDSPLSLKDSTVSIICLPNISFTSQSLTDWPPTNTPLVAVGWGRLSFQGAISMNLQQVTIQSIAYESPTCRPLIENRAVQFCAGVNGGGKDTCQGDSGGPLMMFTSANRWMLVGITSFGIDCATANYSGVYTRVAYFQDWIESTMTSKSTFIQQIPWLTGSVIFSICNIFL